MSILKVIWLIIATIFAGAIVTGVVIAFGLVASVIGVLIAGGVMVMFTYHAWREFRSSRKARK